MKELLRDGVYLRYWLAVVTSYLGDGIARITVIFVASVLTDSPALFISLIVIMQLLPTGILGAFVGPFIDRVSPMVLLVGSDIFRFAIVALMVFATQSPLALVVLILLEGTGKAVFETARMAAIPKVVGSHSFPAAIALFQSTVQVLNIVGPLVGGLLIGLFGVRPVFLMNAATFLVSAALLGSIAALRGATTSASGSGDYLRSIADGVRGVLAVPSLRMLTLALVPAMLAIGLFTTNVNAQLLTSFNLDAFDFGVGQAMIGAGAIVGALLGPTLIEKWSFEKILAVSVVILAVAMLALQPINAYWPSIGLVVVLFWCALAGLGMALVQVPVANLLLRDLPEAIRGRGFALVNALIINLMIVGVLLGGLLGETIGITGSIVGTGVVLLASAVPLAMKARAMPRVQSDA